MNFRKVLFWSHLVVGLTAGLVILTMSVTGMLIAFEHEIVDFAERDVRHIDFNPAPTLDLDTLVAKAREQKPPDAKVTAVVIRSHPEESATVSFGKAGSLYINPHTGEVLGPGSKTHDVMHEIVDFHRWLGSREIGRPITGAANLAFLALTMSGLYLWFQKSVWKFNGKLKGKARDWNWHNVAGIWCLPILLVITSTGAVMSYPWANNLLFRMAGTPPPPPPERPGMPAAVAPKDQAKPAERLARFEQFFQQALQQPVAWSSISLRLPQKSGAPVNAFIQEKGGTFPRRSQLSLEPATAKIVKWEPYQDLPRGRKWRTWARYLHTGEAGGLIGQLIAFLASAGAVLLMYTGWALAYDRYRSYREKGGRKK